MSVLQSIFRAAEDENRRVIVQAMEPRPGCRFLDLGCANGDWTRRVSEHIRAGELHGVEMVDRFAEQARGRGIDVVQADLSEPLGAYGDESFDVIHSNQVIEHLRGTDTFMQEIHRLLKPDGYALISTNNLASWHNILSLVMGWQPPPCNVSDWVNLGNPFNAYRECEYAVRGWTHLRVFTGKALTALARYHGLQPVVERAAGYYPFPPPVARWLAEVDRRHAAFLVHVYVRAGVVP